jgi:hypothetical protein
MTRDLWNLSFGIHTRAYAIAYLLRDMWVDRTVDAVVYSGGFFPWYNGRECCLSFQLTHYPSHQVLCVVFGEHRSSDDLFVDTWIHDTLAMNPLTVADMSETTYSARHMFRDVNEVAKHVTHLVTDFLDNHHDTVV